MPSEKFARVQSIVETAATVLVAGAVLFMALGRADDPSERPSAVRAAARQAPPLPVEPISLEGAILDGSTQARVGLVLYSDFECPFCGRFARDTLPEIQSRYVRPGKVLLAFRHFPLPIHKLARQAAEAAVCADRQGLFWPFHDRLFLDRKNLDRASLDVDARTAGLDEAQFAECMSGPGKAADRVEADRRGGEPLGVSGTPTFFLGTLQEDGRLQAAQRISGALPFEAFQAVLDPLLTSNGTR